MKAQNSAVRHSADSLFDRFLNERLRFIETSWRRKNGTINTWHADAGVWAAVGDRRIATYVERSANLYIWYVDEKMENAVIRRWVLDDKFIEKATRQEPATVK